MLPFFNNTVHLNKIPIRVSTQAVRLKEYFHFHRHIQLCFVLSGTIKHTIYEKEYIQQAGSCAFLLPYIPHVIDATESEDTPLLAHIWFHEDFLKESGYDLLSYGEHTHFNGYKIPLVSDFPNCGDLPTQIIHKIINEFSQKENQPFEKISKPTAELFSLVCTEPTTRKNDSLFAYQLAGVETATKYIENHFQKDISLDTLSKIAGMSRRSFTSHFKRITNMTPLQYILSIRLQTAFKLIKGADMRFDEVARISGLGNRTNLTRTFIKNLGVSPSRFVEEYIKNTSFPYLQSIRDRDKWLYELESSSSETEISDAES